MQNRPVQALCAVAIAVSTAHANAQVVPRPVSEEVFYQLVPIAWRDSNNDAFRYGDFNGMAASLDYLQGLGVTAVWMNPIFLSTAYHGYHHMEPNAVNPWFGTEAEFWSFVNAAHARGIKVILDLVAYLVSRDSTYYTSAFNNPASQYDSWIAFTNAANTQYTGGSYTTWTGSQVRFVHWDLRTPACRTQQINWSLRWLDPNNDGNPSDGIDGWRLDHVHVQYPTGPDGWGYNLDDFWTPWNAALRARNPNVFTFAEQADWGSIGGEFLPTFNGALGKQVMFAIRNALGSGDASAVNSNIQAALNALPADAAATNRTFMISLGDHDVDRFMSVAGDSVPAAKASAAIVFTQPMTPMIYYGDELGMRGVKGNWGSDANDIPLREPFKWNRIAGAPMSNYWQQNASAYNARFALDNDGRSVEEQQGVAGSLLETYRSLITIRRNSAALKRGSFTRVSTNTASVVAYLRQADSSLGGPEQVLVAVRLANQSGAVSFNLSGATIPGGSTTPVMLFGNAMPAITDANKAAYSVSIPAHGVFVSRVGLTIPPPPAPPADIDGRNIPADAAPVGAPNTASATQTCATGFGDNANELDQLFVRASSAGGGGRLRIGLSGNLDATANAIVLLIDTDFGASRGQNILALSNIPSPPGGIDDLTGLRLDAGFFPDSMYFINASGGNVYFDQLTLPQPPGLAVKTYRGSTTVNRGAAPLSGGSNPNGLFAALDVTNTSGVTATSVAGAAGATKGLEISIPYRDLAAAGLPCGTIAVAAFITASDGTVSNQFLPGLPFGSPNLGAAPNLTTRAGNQFLTLLVLSPADVDDGTGGGVPDGGVTIDDLLFYLGLFDAGDPRADTDDGTATGTPDGGVTIEDLLYFLARFDEGC